LLQYYLTYLLERGLNSPEFIRRVQMENADALGELTSPKVQAIF